jgi:fumarate reductase subunit C
MSERPPMLHRPMPLTWWTRKPAYVVFVLRELSAVFIALVAVVTIVQVGGARSGEEAYAQVQALLAHPVSVAVALLALGFALLHSVTFFIAAGKVWVLYLGEQRIPASVVVWGHAAMGVVATAVVAAVVLL